MDKLARMESHTRVQEKGRVHLISHGSNRMKSIWPGERDRWKDLCHVTVFSKHLQASSDLGVMTKEKEAEMKNGRKEKGKRMAEAAHVCTQKYRMAWSAGESGNRQGFHWKRCD
ncbi:unnamed protein product [Protopolystoma xenopodis]|uniref:Uncharacterized protein n=1 Tax=Protopolystoma xenopodis TaxID=117903 RepID=A0A448WLX0_9PLAT|nr:unnamed protein product [Protopolystoma xenopodis]